MSDSSLSVSASALALVSNGNSAGNISNTKSTDSSNGSTFSIVLQDKTNTDSNSQSNTVTGANNNLTSTNVQDTDVTKSDSDVGYEKDLQEIENEINKIEDGSQKLDDNTTAALLLSLQQILNSILKNSNSATAQDSKNSSESVSSITISTDIQSKLTELESTLQQIINDLTAANKQATAQVPDNSALDSTLQNENVKQNINDISSLIETKNNSSVDENFNLESKTNDVVDCLNLINKVLSNASSSTNKNININSDLLNKFKTEFSDIIQGLKGNVTSTDVNSSNLLSSNNYAINSLLDSSSNLNSSTSDNSSMNSNSSDKDTEFLNKLIDNSGKDDSNYSKVTNVINQFIRNNDSTSKLTATQLSDSQIRSTNFAQDVINNVKYMENNNIKDMTVTITPKELGQVLINVSSENGVIKASITATNKEAYNLLNSNIGEINKNLNSQDVRISNVDINIYNGDTTFFKGNSNSDKDTNQNGKKQKTSNVAGIGTIADMEAESMTDLYDNNNVNALA